MHRETWPDEGCRDENARSKTLSMYPGKQWEWRYEPYSRHVCFNWTSWSTGASLNTKEIIIDLRRTRTSSGSTIRIETRRVSTSCAPAQLSSHRRRLEPQNLPTICGSNTHW